jgi:hypothetical protein
MFQKCETAEALNDALHSAFFGDNKLKDKHNLVTSWKIDTDHGDAYMESNGIDAVQQALAAYRDHGLATCKLVNSRMRMVDGITIADEFDNRLLDQCCKELTPRHLSMAVANDVLTQDALKFALYAAPVPETEEAPAASSALVTEDLTDGKAKNRQSKKRKT